MAKVLLLLLDVQGVTTKTGTVFLHPQLFAAHFATQGVVVVAGLFADEKDRFHFFLSLATTFLGHRIDTTDLL